MNISYLNTFITVVEKDSFSTAAKALGLSQPAVSFQVQAIEKELGASLLERRGSGLILTPAGEAAFVSAGRILKTYEELLALIDAARDTVTGRLVLEASTIPGEFLVPRFIAEFKKTYPQVEIVLNISDSEQAIEKIAAHEADIGFVGALPARLPKRITAEPFAEDVLTLVVPASHALAGHKDVSIRSLFSQPFIMREKGSGTRATLEKALVSAGLRPTDLTVALELDGNQAVLSAVEAGLGVAVISVWPSASTARLGSVSLVKINDLDLTRNLYVVNDTGRRANAARRAFLALVG